MNIVHSIPQYFRDEEATKKAFRGGAFHTGDLAVKFSDGSIAVVDRSKDLIISGGEVRILDQLVASFFHVSSQNVSSLAVEQCKHVIWSFLTFIDLSLSFGGSS